MLRAPVSGPEDDFFEVGGDSLKAITFMIDLERALGLELSLTLINEAPRFGRLCEALREQRTTRYVPLVPLKPGRRLTAGLLHPWRRRERRRILPMARRMTYPGAVIGIQARGLDGQETPHTTVEAMAAEYLRAVKARQAERSLLLVRLFLRWARCLRNGAAASGVGRRSRPGRPLRHDDEPAEMAVTFVALHHAPASGALRRQRDRRPHAHLAGGGLENGPSRPRKRTRLFEVRADQCSQGDRLRADRIGAVPAPVLSRRTDAVQSGGA